MFQKKKTMDTTTTAAASMNRLLYYHQTVVHKKTSTFSIRFCLRDAKAQSNSFLKKVIMIMIMIGDSETRPLNDRT